MLVYCIKICSFALCWYSYLVYAVLNINILVNVISVFKSLSLIVCENVNFYFCRGSVKYSLIIQAILLNEVFQPSVLIEVVNTQIS